MKKTAEHDRGGGPIGRRGNALAGGILGIPLVGSFASAARKKRKIEAIAWIPLGNVDQFPEGETRLATFRNPLTRPWDGATGDIPCWVRRLPGEHFQVFAINCAHLGCPVTWFPQSGLFMCPCHGGVYYEASARASGPPPRGLFQLSRLGIENGKRVQTGEHHADPGHLRLHTGTDEKAPV